MTERQFNSFSKRNNYLNLIFHIDACLVASYNVN